MTSTCQRSADRRRGRDRRTLRALGRCLGSLALAGGMAACEALPASHSASGSEPERRQGQPAAVDIGRVPGIELGVEDAIDGLDALLDLDGTLHLVWREVDRAPSGTGLPAYRARYLSCPGADCDGRRGRELPWPRPTGPRLVRADGRVHAVDGRRLERLALAPDDPAGRPTAELPADAAPALDVALAGSADGMAVVYLARPEPDGPWELHWLRRTAAGEGRPRRLLELPASALAPATPALLAAGDSVGVLLALNLEGRSAGGAERTAAETFRPRGSLLYLRSDDAGESWHAPVDVAADDGTLGPVAAVELAAAGGELLALVSAGHLHAAVSADGGATWRPTRAITGEGRAGVVRAAGGAVAWIDDRFRRSERRWWKPLGGFPWSDSPEWANNDVLSLDLPAVLARHAGGTAADPRRVTPDLGYAGALRLAAARGRTLAVWAGRRRVGRERDSAGEPPAIFYRRLR